MNDDVEDVDQGLVAGGQPCRDCGEQVPVTWVYCSWCGSQLRDAVDEGDRPRFRPWSITQIRAVVAVNIVVLAWVAYHVDDPEATLAGFLCVISLTTFAWFNLDPREGSA